jgi:hypothetical protein
MVITIGGMCDVYHMLITWTTYGTWLPGNERGWRKRQAGIQISQPLLEQWCRAQMKGEAMLLNPVDRLPSKMLAKNTVNFADGHCMR